MKTNTDHVVLEKQDCVCRHCGQRYTLHLPASVNLIVAIVDAFIRDHRHCQKREPA